MDKVLEYLTSKGAIGAVLSPGEIHGITPAYTARTGLELRRPMAIERFVGEASAPEYDRQTRASIEANERREFWAPASGNAAEWWQVVKVPVDDRVVMEARAVEERELVPWVRGHLRRELGDFAVRLLSDDSLVTWLKLHAHTFQDPSVVARRSELMHEGAQSVRTVSRHLKVLREVGAVRLERTSHGLRVVEPTTVLQA
ncbi:MAG TPA: hypothetical protein DEA08_21815 [Planctomycetes bacterium]|nr:hypothetical protein [Planctomycetota bacterium]|tara:strand:+ start:384 stop:983 length:600 start_codon:yes stop_codon:yes gene_type:complete